VRDAAEAGTTMQQASAVVALVSALVTVVVTSLGVLERRRAFKAQQAELIRQATRWSDEFAAERSRQEVQLRKEFLLEQYRYRLTSYAAVMKTLGAVSDVTIGSDKKSSYEALRQKSDLLKATADALYEHLYGAPGLLMTMPTRNYLHAARKECLAFLEGTPGDSAGDRLIDAFFYARRYLRADLELTDDRTPESLEALAKRLGDQSRAP
jgi:hypothetical protein